MAEQATRIADQISGDYIATRDGYINDGDGKARTIQIIDFASRQLASGDISTIRTGVSVVDGVNMGALPAGLTSNLISIGDRSVLVVFPMHSASDGEVTITPIIFSAGSVAIGIRASKASAMGSFAFVKAGLYYSPQVVWDVQGAEKIGLHVTVIGGTANFVTLNAGVI